MMGQREGDGDERGVMEQDLVEGSVATAAAAALASAATKAKVKDSSRAFWVPSGPFCYFRQNSDTCSVGAQTAKLLSGHSYLPHRYGHSTSILI